MFFFGAFVWGAFENTVLLSLYVFGDDPNAFFADSFKVFLKKKKKKRKKTFFFLVLNRYFLAQAFAVGGW